MALVNLQLVRRLSGNALTQLIGQSNLRRSTPEAYRKLREIVCTFERFGTLGNDIQLTEKEIEVNHVIMCLKMDKYNMAIKDPSHFVPGYHIFDTLDKIRTSPLFRLISKMPKGGALKTHDASLCSTEFLIGLTYKPNLWVRLSNDGSKIDKFRFATQEPQSKDCKDVEWHRMEQVRECWGEATMCKYLNRAFSMYPMSNFASNKEAWDHMMNIFWLIDGLLRFRPIWAEYFYNALEEFQADGVQYIEVRTLLQRLYTLDTHRLPVKETVRVYQDTLRCFKAKHPEFIDARLIYSPLRHVKASEVAKFVTLCGELNKEFPDLLIGFDLVGQEDIGYPLSSFVNELIKMPPQIQFYFHAGQTNWFGSRVDENIIDAVLLGTRRIGHGYAMLKHPLMMYMVKKLGIAIEVCPVCNQVLQLGSDYRNHPAAALIANDIPMVISSGNPSFWRTTPLSHDFYMMFLGIAPRNTDLKFLKRICKNSIKYSALTDEQKANAMQKWKDKWEKWIDWIVKDKDKILEWKS